MKRGVDLVVGLSVLVMLVVPIVMVAILVKLTSKGSMLYWSNRVGHKNKLFRMPKFRTMQMDTPEMATHLMNTPDTYLSPIGGFIRRSSLEELPIPEKVALDVEYLERQSFWFDMYILWLTVLKVVKKDGVSH